MQNTYLVLLCHQENVIIGYYIANYVLTYVASCVVQW